VRGVESLLADWDDVVIAVCWVVDKDEAGKLSVTLRIWSRCKMVTHSALVPFVER
jgi:hypothetical protein